MYRHIFFCNLVCPGLFITDKRVTRGSDPNVLCEIHSLICMIHQQSLFMTGHRARASTTVRAKMVQAHAFLLVHTFAPMLLTRQKIQSQVFMKGNDILSCLIYNHFLTLFNKFCVRDTDCFFHFYFKDLFNVCETPSSDTT